jgi:hypothetical protein
MKSIKLSEESTGMNFNDSGSSKVFLDTASKEKATKETNM